uniref:Peptidase S1 domain-containing protein n=1 Tax=Otus sunia TaxID=257818 RepID=A0A8C8AVQ9_9STRI
PKFQPLLGLANSSVLPPQDSPDCLFHEMIRLLELFILPTVNCCSSLVVIFQPYTSEDGREHSELVRSAALIIYHPRYNSGSLDNDIMLIKMATTMDYSADIQLTALLSSCAKEGPKCLFQTANFPMCQEAYPGEITSNMICVGFLDGGKGYDSGPAVCIGKLQGIVSWENEYALKGYPSVYTKVCNYVDRIKQIIAA